MYSIGSHYWSSFLIFRIDWRNESYSQRFCRIDLVDSNSRIGHKLDFGIDYGCINNKQQQAINKEIINHFSTSAIVINSQ